MNVKQLLTTALLTTLLAGTVTAQSVTYSTATETGKTKDFSTITSPTSARGSLSSATSIALTGTWTTTNIQALQNALKSGNGTLNTTVNSTLTSANLSSMSFPTANTEVNFTDLFSYCKALKTVTLPSSDVTNKMSLFSTFSNCVALEEVDISHFNNISNLETTFDGCSLLTKVTMPTAENNNKVSCAWTFRQCNKLASPIDLSGFKNISNLRSTFLHCHELTDVKMPTAVNNNAMEVNYTFDYCYKLSSPIDLSGFKNASVTAYKVIMGGLFRDCHLVPYVKIHYLGKTAATNIFTNANPNMIKYMTTGDNPDLTNFQNEKNLIVNGKAYNDIVLADTVKTSFIIPEAFDLNGKTITYTRNFSDKPSGIDGSAAGWETICLPFTPTAIAGTNKESNAVALSPFNADGGNAGSDDGAVPFWLRSLSTEKYAAATSIAPNTPYIIAMPNNEKYAAKYNVTGNVTFSATGTGTEVVATTASPTAATGSSYALNANYNVVPQAENIYVIDTDGTAFVANSANAIPFHPYATANNPANAPARFVIGDEGGGATAIEEAILMGHTPGSRSAESIRVYAAEGVLTIEALQACTVRVYSMDGQLVRTVQVSEGANKVNGLAHGVYVVDGVKVVM